MPLTQKAVSKRKVLPEELFENFFEQDITDEEKIGIINLLIKTYEKYNPKGFFLVRNAVMDSSQFGQVNVIAWGENNTIKDIFQFTQIQWFSVNGLPSGASKLIAWSEMNKTDLIRIRNMIEKNEKKGKKK